MSTKVTVHGFTADGEKWNQMKLIYDLCLTNNIKAPDEVTDYFYDPNNKKDRIDISAAIYHSPNGNPNEDTYVLDLKKLDRQVTHVRFSVSKS